MPAVPQTFHQEGKTENATDGFSRSPSIREMTGWCLAKKKDIERYSICDRNAVG
ncbi:hypothetical protein Q5692_35520 [Microcoleus sp. C2C3]|uniref:hypothetical protein n=1 Tax=unclassified Microcoleus TaxID=2642155 RepID=UPI002FCF3EFA